MSFGGGLARSAHLDDLVQLLLSKPLLRGPIGSSLGAWAGPFGSLALQPQVREAAAPSSACPTPAGDVLPGPSSRHHAVHMHQHHQHLPSTARSLSTSAAPHRHFQSVLRKPTTKANMFNTQNFTEWKNSGFDARIALKLLESVYLGKLQQQQEVQSRALQRELGELLWRCASVEEVQQIVREVQAHMSSDNLVLAISRITKLQQTSVPPASPSPGPPLVPDLLDSLLPPLRPHLPALRTSQLASVMASLARSGHSPAPAISAAIQEQLDSEKGLARADAARPRETASLMLAAARLGWGSPLLWSRLGEATLAQLKKMSPNEVAQALQAAAMSPSAPSCGASSLLWAHAERVVMRRRDAYDTALLAKVLLSFSVSGTPSGAQLRAEMLARLTAGRGGPGVGALTPPAVVSLLQASARLRRGDGGGGGVAESERATVEALVQLGLGAAAHAVTRLSTRQLEQLLRAVGAAYGSDSAADAPPRPRVVSDLLSIIGDVLSLRGLKSEEAGAVPPPEAAALPGAQKGLSAARVLVQLGRLGYFQGRDAAERRQQRLLQRLLEDARQLQALGLLGPAVVAELERGFAAAAAGLATDAARSAAAGMARLSARVQQPAATPLLDVASEAAPAPPT